MREAPFLSFRDFLPNNPQAVIEYENIKRKLENTEKNRKSNPLGKTELINKIIDFLIQLTVALVEIACLVRKIKTILKRDRRKILINLYFKAT